MKKYLRHLLVLAAAAVTLALFTNNAAAQGNFDPAQARERALTRYREQLDVKSDADWKKLEVLIGNVMDARTAVGGFGFGGRGGGRGGRGGGDAAANTEGRGNNNRNRNQGASAEEQALEKAIEDKASADEIKTKLAAVRESRKSKEAALEKAQNELRQALSPRQEAAAVLARLVK